MMTIGTLARRTGVTVKTLRQCEAPGLIYTAGRGAGNDRLFDDMALWWVGVIGPLRGLGRTLAEVQDLVGSYLGLPEQPVLLSSPAAPTSAQDPRFWESGA